MFASHNHGGGDHKHQVKADLGNINEGGPKTGTARGFIDTTNSGVIINTEGGSETRPKNVALLYCEKNESP